MPTTMQLRIKHRHSRVQPFATILHPVAEKRGTIKRYALFAVTVAAIFLSSCREKQLSDPVTNTTHPDESPASANTNTRPNADAGLNKCVVIPASSATLAGSGSDAEGPVTFLWKQVKGPTVAAIAQPTQPVTKVSNLKPGVYRFVLTVKDTKGASRSDTTVVSVMERLKWTVSGLAREAIVHRPVGGTGAPPVLIIFHGHGATDTAFAAEKVFEDSWEEAVVVYPQGLRTTSVEDPNCKKSGWQTTLGEANCVTGVIDQDLKFFDAMLPTIKNKYSANLNLVFVHGFSNGGHFVYNPLWSGRGSKIAGLAPSSAALDSIIGTTGKLPKPLMHTVGLYDELVLYSEQEQTVQKVRILNQCSPAGTLWATGPNGIKATRYPSPINAPVVFLTYNGKHKYPDPAVPQLIVRFFKEVAADITAATP